MRHSHTSCLAAALALAVTTTGACKKDGSGGAADKPAVEQAPKEYRDKFVGQWRSPRMELDISPSGQVRYKREDEGGKRNFTGPIGEFTKDSFSVKLLAFSSTFKIDKPPYEEGGVRKMVIDGELLTEVGSRGKQPHVAVCEKLDDSGLCPTSKARFTPDTPLIRVTYRARELPPDNTAYAVRWVAEDVGKAAPKGHVINVYKGELKGGEGRSKADFFRVAGSLSRPNKGWPVGRYRVDIEVGGKTVAQQQFAISPASPGR